MSGINERRGTEGELWQPRFFDRALRTVKEYHAKLEYIHLNPVRAGLVGHPRIGDGRVLTSTRACAQRSNGDAAV